MEQDWAQLFYPQGVADEDKPRLDRVRKAFADLGTVLQQELRPGRYKSIVKTDLEKVAAVATKSFTHE